MIHKKAYPRRAPDEFGIEQTHDLKPVRLILEASGLSIEGLDWPSACYLLAYRGVQPIGTVGIESRIDAAMLRSLAVSEPMRHRGIGGALVMAARVAAHTRGARTLYTFAPEPYAEWFIHLGFAPVPIADLIHALAGTFLVDHLRKAGFDLTEQAAPMAVEIANDGVIER